MPELAIEAIGDDADQAMRRWSAVERSLGVRSEWKPQRPWVAEVGFGRVGYNFLRGRKDYSQSNSVGSRGVYVWYTLREGQLYRVQDLVSWRHTERYYCAVRDGQIVRFTDEEAKACLSDPSAFQSWMRHEIASPGSSTTPTKST